MRNYPKEIKVRVLIREDREASMARTSCIDNKGHSALSGNFRCDSYIDRQTLPILNLATPLDIIHNA